MWEWAGSGTSSEFEKFSLAGAHVCCLSTSPCLEVLVRYKSQRDFSTCDLLKCKTSNLKYSSRCSLKSRAVLRHMGNFIQGLSFWDFLPYIFKTKHREAECTDWIHACSVLQMVKNRSLLLQNIAIVNESETLCPRFSVSQTITLPNPRLRQLLLK